MTEDEVLVILKAQLRKVSPQLQETDFSPEAMLSKHPNKAKYYLKSVDDNLFDSKIHSKLDSRANAIKSSAAMILNTLGLNDFIWNEKKYNQIKYEEKLLAILSDDREHKAHLDVRFIAEDKSEIVFVESKLLEWFSSPKNLSKAYLEKTRYPSITGEAKNVFIDFFKSILLGTNKIDSDNRFVGYYRKYDAIQMTIHILAIFNYFQEHKEYKKIRLVNLVWDNEKCKQYMKEAEEAKEYLNLVKKELYPLFKDVDFSVEYIPYSKFYTEISFSDEKRKKYLQRYIIS